MSLTHFSLFSGIGGLDLAAEWAGFETVAQIEKDPFCRAVLARHWPNVPKFEDIKDVTADALRSAGIAQPPTVLSGGFPCQPFSCAGKRRGTEDDRYLWPEMLRVVQELRPAWVVGENVAGIVSMALDDVCADLEREGYACRPLVFPAAGVGAPHKRDRVFIVAHSGGVASGSSDQATRSLGMYLAARDHALCGDLRQLTGAPSEDVADDDRSGCPGARLPVLEGRPIQTSADSRGRREDVPHADLGVGAPERQDRRTGRFAQPVSWGEGEMPSPVLESGVCGMADGFSAGLDRRAYGIPAARNRVARLRALGNAVVPAQAYPIFAAVAAIETGAIA